jgi:hypothetical protein
VSISLIGINSRLEVLKDSSALGYDSMSIGKFLVLLYGRVAEGLIIYMHLRDSLTNRG